MAKSLSWSLPAAKSSNRCGPNGCTVIVWHTIYVPSIPPIVVIAIVEIAIVRIAVVRIVEISGAVIAIVGIAVVRVAVTEISIVISIAIPPDLY